MSMLHLDIWQIFTHHFPVGHWSRNEYFFLVATLRVESIAKMSVIIKLIHNRSKKLRQTKKKKKTKEEGGKEKKRSRQNKSKCAKQ